MITNTASMTPTDIWKLSDNYILPQRGDQISLGLYRNFNVKALELSAEAYYKNINNILDYKGGAELLMNDHLETDMINGNLKTKKFNHSSLTFSVYNALGRRNPYSIFFKAEDGVVKGYQMSIFGQPIFMVTYNFRIRGNASNDF